MKENKNYQNQTRLSGLEKIKMGGFIHPGWLAGVSRGPKSNQKKLFKKKYKYDQNGLIHPEN